MIVAIPLETFFFSFENPRYLIENLKLYPTLFKIPYQGGFF
jgi:hypothetical protein